MKKLLVVLLTLVLCVATLTSCDLANQFLENFQLLRGDSINVNEAADYIYNMYKDMEVTATDYELTAKTNIGGVSYDVTWSVNTNKVKITKKDENTYLVDLNERSPEDVPYVLTATIRALDRTTAKKQFNLMVPLYDAIPHADYMAAEKSDKDVTIAGIVVAINSKEGHNNKYNHLFLADADVTGGYYCYKTKTDPAKLGIEVGMTVKVTGKISPYSGMQEMTDGQVAILDKTIKEVPVVDITEKFANGEDLKAYVGLPVTIKGVEIGNQDMSLETSQYLYFKLNGKTSYIRTYVSDFPAPLKINKEGEVYTSPDKDTIDAAHANHFGWEANATGILVMYNSNPYLIPMGVDCFEYIKEIVKTDENKVDDSIAAVTFETSFSKDAVVELPAPAYKEDVTFAWESNNAAVVVDGNKLTITVPDGKTEVTLTLTATCGQVTKTATYTLKLSKVITPVKDIIEIGAAKEHNAYTEEKYIVAGIITEVYNTTYGNMKITDELGNVLTIYGTYIEGTQYGKFEGAKPVAGDYVVLSGIVGQYNGTPQVKNADITSFTTPTALKDAATIGAAKEHNTYTEDKYIVTGVIESIASDKYGNMTLKDAEGNTLYFYGLYSADGANRYDAMTVKPAVGDTITVYGVLGRYNETVQMKNGWLVAHTVATTDEGGEGEGENPPAVEDPAASSKLSVKEAAELGASKEHNVYTEGKYFVTGEIVSIVADKDDATKPNKYGNMTIKDADGNTLYLYGLYNIDGTIRFDAMETKPAVGDTITVYGIIGQYEGTAQLKNGWLVKAPAADSTLSLIGANTLGLGCAHNKYTEDKYYVTGEIVSIDPDKNDATKPNFYGNMTIKDADGNTFYLYGLKVGEKKYGELEVKPVVGDTVTMYGVIGQYNGKAQMNNGQMTDHKVPAPEGGDTPAAPVTASKTIAALITELGWDKNTTKQTFTLDDKVTVKINGGLNTGKAYDGDHIRIYATDSPAGTITISVPEGYELVSIKITTVTGTYAFLCVDGTDTDICNQTIDVSGSSVVLNSVKNGSNGKQVRVTAIEVVYKPVD